MKNMFISTFLMHMKNMFISTYAFQEQILLFRIQRFPNNTVYTPWETSQTRLILQDTISVSNI